MKKGDFIAHWTLERRARLLYVCDRPPSRFRDWSTRKWKGDDDWVPDEPSTLWTTLTMGDRVSNVLPPPLPAYLDLEPGQRRRYLRWLAAEKLDDGVPEGYAHLYYFGLERRCFGAARREAWKEIVALRAAFPESFLIQSCSEQVLVASGLLANDWESLAIMAQGLVFDDSPLELKSLLLHYLAGEEALDRPPAKWLLEALGETSKRDTKTGRDREAPQETGKQASIELGVEEILPFFEDAVRMLLFQKSLADRLRDLGTGTAEASLEPEAANSSRPFPRLDPIRYRSVLKAQELLKQFRETWRIAKNRAAVDWMERQDAKRRRQRKTRSVQMDLLPEVEQIDVGREIRRAARLWNQQSRRADAVALLRRLEVRAEANRRHKKQIRKMLQVFR